MANTLKQFRAVKMPRQNRLIMCLFYLCLLQLISCKITLHICGDDMEEQYILRHGDDLQLCCSVDGEEGTTADDLSFSLAGIKLPSEQLSQKTRKAFISKPPFGRYTYYCSMNQTNAVKTVYVTNPPSDVSDFKCFSDNLETLNCTWNRPKGDNISKYELYYTVGGARTFANVKYGVDANDTLMYSSWTEKPKGSDQRYRNNESTYYFTLKANNSLGVHEQNITIDHYSIVKPKPPTLIFTESATPHSVVLKCKLDRPLFHLKQVKFKIEYQVEIPEFNNTVYTVFTENQTNSLSKLHEFVLSNLTYAHAKYKVRVCVKSSRATEEEYWSNPKESEFNTTSEQPAPPQIPAGAFEQQVYENQRIVHVYWKPLQEYEEAGADFKYVVNVTSSNYSKQNTTTVGHLMLENNPLDALGVAIWSDNEAGSSVDHSYLYVPPSEKVAKDLLKSFTTLSYGNGTYELMWLNRVVVDNYTIFWCKHDGHGIGTSGVNFIQLSAPKTVYKISLTPKYSYRFAISANKGYTSSGMTWAEAYCDLSVQNLAMSKFHITVEINSYGKDYVELSWSLDCLYKDGIITGYIVKYCYITLNGNCSFNQSIPSSQYVVDPNITKTRVNDLFPFTKYIFEVYANTTVGPKPGNYTIQIKTSEDTPTEPSNINIPKDKITNNSVTITLKPPSRLNGPIKNIQFIVYNNDTEISRTNADCNENIKQCKDIIVTGLDSFMEYSLSVKSYNYFINSLSSATVKKKVKTKVGAPGPVTRVSYSNAKNKLSWHRPLKEGGNLSKYEIKIKPCEICEEETIVETTNKYYIDDADCEERVYYVRGVNIDENRISHYGDWSAASNVSCNNNTWKRPLYITAASLLGLTIICLLVKLYKIIDDAKSITKVKPKFHPSLLLDEENKTVKPPTPISPNRSKVISDTAKVKNTLYDSMTKSNDSLTTENKFQKFDEKRPFLQVGKTIGLKLPDIPSPSRETNLPVASFNTINENELPSVSARNELMQFIPLSSGYVRARPNETDFIYCLGRSQNTGRTQVQPNYSLKSNTTNIPSNNLENNQTALVPSFVKNSSGYVPTTSFNPTPESSLANKNPVTPSFTKMPTGYVKAGPSGLPVPSLNLPSKTPVQPTITKLSSGYVQASPSTTKTNPGLAEKMHKQAGTSCTPIDDTPARSGETYKNDPECSKPTMIDSNTSSNYVLAGLNPYDGSMVIDATRVLQPSSKTNEEVDVESRKPSDEHTYTEILEPSASVDKNTIPDASVKGTQEFVSPEDKLINIRNKRRIQTDTKSSPNYSQFSLL